MKSLLDSISRLVDAVTTRISVGNLSNKIIALAAVANVIMAIMLWISTRSSAKTARSMLKRTYRIDLDVTWPSIVPTIFNVKNVGTMSVDLVEQSGRPFVGNEWLSWGTYDFEGITIPVGGNIDLLRPYVEGDAFAGIVARRIPFLFELEVVYKGVSSQYECHYSRYEFDHDKGIFLLSASHTRPLKKLRQAFKSDEMPQWMQKLREEEDL